MADQLEGIRIVLSWEGVEITYDIRLFLCFKVTLKNFKFYFILN
jgi:hypothetical protein